MFRAVQSSGGTASQDESCPTPNQNPASPQRYMEEKKNTEKKRKTQKTGEILVSEESKQTADKPGLMMSSERDGKVDSIYKRIEQSSTKDVGVIAPPH